MFGKLYESTYTGSMVGSGALAFAVWDYAIAHCRNDDRVELNPVLIGAVLGEDPAGVVAALEKFCAPDPRSRSKREDGRKLIREGEFQYFMVNHADYRSMRNEDERREYNRLKQRECRAKKKASNSQLLHDNSLGNVNSLSQTCVPPCAHADADADARDKNNSSAPEVPAGRVRCIYPEDFLSFWAAYPRRKNKGTALKVFLRAKQRADLVDILAGVERAKHSADWRKEDGRYIPYPATWLNANGWEDEFDLPESAQPASVNERLAEEMGRFGDDPLWDEYRALVVANRLPLGFDAFLASREVQP